MGRVGSRVKNFVGLIGIGQDIYSTHMGPFLGSVSKLFCFSQNSRETF